MREQRQLVQPPRRHLRERCLRNLRRTRNAVLFESRRNQQLHGSRHHVPGRPVLPMWQQHGSVLLRPHQRHQRDHELRLPGQRTGLRRELVLLAVRRLRQAGLRLLRGQHLRGRRLLLRRPLRGRDGSLQQRSLGRWGHLWGDLRRRALHGLRQSIPVLLWQLHADMCRRLALSKRGLLFLRRTGRSLLPRYGRHRCLRRRRHLLAHHYQ